MNSNKLWMTDQIPSGFGMPGYGHTFEVCVPAMSGMTDAVKRGLGLAPSHIAGNSAWRPPTC